MKHFTKFFLGLLIIGFTSCKKEKAVIVQDNSITGNVQLTNHVRDDIYTSPDDNSMINVSLQNGSETIAVSAKKDGSFLLPDFEPADLIDITYSYEGYGTMHQYFTKQEFTAIKNGERSIQSVTLSKISTVVVNSISATEEGTTLKVKCNVSFDELKTTDAAVRFVVKKDDKAAASYDNCTSVNDLTTSFRVVNGDNNFEICMSCMTECGHESGDLLFLKAYGDTPYPNMYNNPLTGKIVVPGLNTNSKAEAISFIVP